MNTHYVAFISVITFALATVAFGRDLDGRYAKLDPKMHDWFEKLQSKKGPCCADADGNVVTDADWETKDGHYRVRLAGKWIDVPDEAVVKEPNLYGPTMVWPIYSWNLYGANEPMVRCFMPGSLS